MAPRACNSNLFRTVLVQQTKKVVDAFGIVAQLKLLQLMPHPRTTAMVRHPPKKKVIPRLRWKSAWISPGTASHARSGLC